MKRAKPAAKRPSMELTSRRKYLVYAIVVSTWLSGVIWIALHYFFAQHGEFGAEPNPFEFWFLALHGACAFAALWLAGWIWTTHIVPWWSARRRRNSGIVLIGLVVLLIVSGYLLYYASGDALREWVSIVHWSVGLAVAIPMIVHALRSRRYRTTRPR